MKKVDDLIEQYEQEKKEKETFKEELAKLRVAIEEVLSIPFSMAELNLALDVCNEPRERNAGVADF